MKNIESYQDNKTTTPPEGSEVKKEIPFLTIGALKEIIEKYDDDVLICLFDINEGTRSDILSSDLDDEWVEENGFLDIRIK